jgi:AraC-like DNA-binding protein
MLIFRKDKLIGSQEGICLQKYTTSDPVGEHLHEFIELVYIWEGAGEHTISGRTYAVQRGDMLFFNLGDTHSFRPHEVMGIYNCLFTPEFFGAELLKGHNALDILTLTAFRDFQGRELPFLPKVTFKGRELVRVEGLLENMYAEFVHKESGYRQALEGLVTALVIKLFREFQASAGRNIYQVMDSFSAEILEYLEKNYNKKITLAELARQNCYNPSYFSQLFKECFGKSFTAYLQDLRVTKSLELLTGDLSVEQVSLAVGYGDKKQFYKAFRKRMGLTPGAYRQRIMRKPTKNN